MFEKHAPVRAFPGLEFISLRKSTGANTSHPWGGFVRVFTATLRHAAEVVNPQGRTNRVLEYLLSPDTFDFSTQACLQNEKQ